MHHPAVDCGPPGVVNPARDLQNHRAPEDAGGPPSGGSTGELKPSDTPPATAALNDGGLSAGALPEARLGRLEATDEQRKYELENLFHVSKALESRLEALEVRMVASVHSMVESAVHRIGAGAAGPSRPVAAAAPAAAGGSEVSFDPDGDVVVVQLFGDAVKQLESSILDVTKVTETLHHQLRAQSARMDAVQRALSAERKERDRREGELFRSIQSRVGTIVSKVEAVLLTRGARDPQQGHSTATLAPSSPGAGSWEIRGPAEEQGRVMTGREPRRSVGQLVQELEDSRQAGALQPDVSWRPAGAQRPTVAPGGASSRVPTLAAMGQPEALSRESNEVLSAIASLREEVLGARSTGPLLEPLRCDRSPSPRGTPLRCSAPSPEPLGAQQGLEGLQVPLSARGRSSMDAQPQHLGAGFLQPALGSARAPEKVSIARVLAPQASQAWADANYPGLVTAAQGSRAPSQGPRASTLP